MIEYENLKRLNLEFEADLGVAFKEALDSGMYILGSGMNKFEDEFASYLGVKRFVGLSSGLDALILSLKGLNLPEGSEVIVPSNTYIATILAVIHANLKPVLVEPDIETYNICPHKISEAITPKTSAILVVHLYGKCCEMDKIYQICQLHNLKLIEDCAQAHGAKFKGKLAGTFGDMGAFSFYPTKNLGALGDAGGVAVNSDSLAANLVRLRNYGSRIKYFNEVIGHNSRLDDLQARFLSVKLRQLDKINNHKRRLAQIYLNELKQDFIKPVVHHDYYDVYHIFNVRHERRDELREYLLKNEIKTEIHYPVAPHHQEAFKNIFSGMIFPISEEIHKTTLSLPISYIHNESDIYRTIEVMNSF